MKCKLLALFTLFYTVTCMQIATVYYSQQGFKVQLGVYDIQKGVVVAQYNPTLESKGWDTLIIETGNVDLADNMKAYAAGFIEGSLTQKRIWNHHTNMNAFTWKQSGMPQYVVDFFKQQKKWTEDQIAANRNNSYWQQVDLIHKQFEGLVEGYNQAATIDEKISFTDMHTMSSFGDLFDIINIKHDNRPKWDNMTTDDLNDYISRNTHCSALIKITPDLSDIYFGHTSWFTYSSMTRIFKTYKFSYKNSLTKAKSISFSSYPAVIASNDDFYITSQNMVIIETTNVVLDNNLFDFIKPTSLLCWQRAMLANRMSNTSTEWVQIFSQYNSGTYNNQFMVLDLKLFTPGQPIVNNTLWIAEQLPGIIQKEDVSGILQYGYWPSYNVPYSANIRDISGVDDMLKKHPKAYETLGYQNCARATIFRRDQTKVDSIDTIKKILRYNDYEHDPLSKHNPSYAISSRMDLGKNIVCMGGYDTKVSSYSNIMNGGIIEIMNGPTYDNVPVFEFHGQCEPYTKSVGLPKTWKFDWMTVH